MATTSMAREVLSHLFPALPLSRPHFEDEAV